MGTLMFGMFPLSFAAFAPQSKKELKDAIDECLKNLFGDCPSYSQKGKIGDWDVSGVSDMSGLFQDTSFNADLSKWDVSSVTNMNGMLKGASRFDQDISKWNVSSVTNMQDMFNGAERFGDCYTCFHDDISKWGVSQVVNMRGMFSSASHFEDDISKWDVSRVTDMSSMFMNAKRFTQKLCGTAWVLSKAKKDDIFKNSPGSIPITSCTKAST